MRALIAAIHGGRTRPSPVSWPDHLDAWMWRRYPEVKVLKKEYLAEPVPRWHSRLKNVWRARKLASEMELLLGGMRGEPTAQLKDNFPPPWFVGHSTGADIALLTTKRLLARGYRVGGLILTGAVCEPDNGKNGVREWLERGELGAAIAYASEEGVCFAPEHRAETFEQLLSDILEHQTDEAFYQTAAA